jgi:hypothetical protein
MKRAGREGYLPASDFEEADGAGDRFVGAIEGSSGDAGILLYHFIRAGPGKHD